MFGAVPVAVAEPRQPVGSHAHSDEGSANRVTGLDALTTCAVIFGVLGATVLNQNACSLPAYPPPASAGFRHAALESQVVSSTIRSRSGTTPVPPSVPVDAFGVSATVTSPSASGTSW